jgi:YD repeat-containing protein
MLWVGVAFAGGELPGFYQDSGLSPNRASVNHNNDEHIDPFSGKLLLRHIDGTLPGNAGFDLIIQRSHNTLGSTFGSISDTQSYNRSPNVGVGWNLLIGGRVFNAVGTGTACAGGTQMSFEMPDGGRQALIKQADGTFLSAARWKAVCTGGGVQVFTPNGTRYDMLQTIAETIPNTIQNAPYLYPTHIQDRNGNYADFSYTTTGPTTLLSSISTSDGRSLSYSYTLFDTVYLLTSLSTPSGRTWRYNYYSIPALTNLSGKGTAYFLYSVDPPAGGSWIYDNYLLGQVGAFSIAQFWYPEGGTIEYTYAFVDFHDGSGNTPVVSTKSMSNVEGLAGSPTSVWQYTYTPGSAGVNDVTKVTAPLGTFTYKNVGTSTVGSGSTWKVGLLMQKTTQDLTSAVVQDETYTWDKQQISTYPTYRQFGLNDGVTYAPLMTQHMITRNGINWTTTNSNFDAYGNPQTVVEAGERTHTITRAYYIDTTKWILNFPANESTTGIGSITRSFDTNGNVLNENRYGVSTSYTYSSVDGTITSRTDANSHTTNFSNYKRGVAQLEQRPASVTINRAVDQEGNITSQSDGAGNVYTYGYDGLGRMTAKTPPIGAATSIAWAQSTSRTATRGAYVESLSFDGAGRPFILTRDGTPTAFAYDVFSNKVFESLPGKVTFNTDGIITVVGTQIARDILARPTLVTNSDTSTRSLSHVGSSLTETDELAHTTTYQFQAFGDPDKRFVSQRSLPEGNNITMTHDDLGNLTSVSQGTFTRNYHYNGSFFLTSIDDPETGTTTFGRDLVGNMTSRTVGGKTTNFGYDNLNRLTSITYPGGNNVAITYLGNGRTSTVTNASASRSYTYDNNANLASETLTVGGQTFTVGYTYNANDALATITYPRTGEVVTYSPDNLGRPTAASPYVTSVSYFASGNPSQITYATGIQMNYVEDSRARVGSAIAQKADLSQPQIVNKQYRYLANNNVFQIGDLVDGFFNMQMTYDKNDQLTAALGPWGTSNMAYDPVGNLTTYGVNAHATTGILTSYYGYDASNKLTSVQTRDPSQLTVTTTNFTYDGYGNVTSESIGGSVMNAYQYDDASNLTCVNCGTGTQITYAYDGNNRRVSRTQNGVTTYYVHAANGDLILEYTPSQNKGIEHFYLHGKRIASKTVPM